MRVDLVDLAMGADLAMEIDIVVDLPMAMGS